MLLIIGSEEAINSTYYRISLSCFILVLISGLAYSSNSQYKNWWNDRPVDDRYYFGVGSIDAKDRNHVERSRSMAMEQLTLQLFADIYSTTERDIEENNDISTRNKYKTETKIFSRSQLSEVEFVASKKVNKIYYTLIRLDKAKYQEYKDKQIKDIRGLYDQGVMYSSENNIKGALTYLIRSFEKALQVPGDAIYHNDKNLVDEIPIEIDKIMSGLSLSKYPALPREGQYDRPIADSLEVRVKTSNKSKAVKGLPIMFKYRLGHGELLNARGFTDGLGKVTNKILKVQSREKQQTLTAFIDLSHFLDDEISKEDPDILSALKKYQESASVSFLLNISETFNEDIGLVVVGDPDYFTSKSLDRLNTSFRKYFNDKYNLIDGEKVDRIIEKGGYLRTSDLCTNDACQIKIGKELGVQKLIFVKCNYYTGELRLRVEIILRDIEVRNRSVESEEYEFRGDEYIDFDELDNEIAINTVNDRELEGPLSVDLIEEKNRKRIIDGRLPDFIEKHIPSMLNHFWKMQNPATIRIMNTQTAMSGKLKLNGEVEKWFKPEYPIKIPSFGNEKYPNGDYILEVDHVGYESIREAITLREGTNSPPINFIRKNPKTAFLKSLLIPGLGQLYSSEQAFHNRKYIGYAFAAAATISVVTTGGAWSSYSKKKVEYEDAYDIYMNQKLLEGVETNRLIAQQKNKDMRRQFTSALLLTGVTAAVWIGNAIEAHINFPEYGLANSSIGLDLAFQTFSGEPAPVIQVNYNW